MERRYAGGRVHWTALYRDGSGRYHSAGTYATSDEADWAWMSKAVELGRSLPSDPRRELVPFADFVERYFQQVVFNSGNTKRTYHYVTRAHLVPTFGTRPLREVDREAIATWIRSLTARGYKPRTVTSYKLVLSAILAKAVTWGYVTYNPCLGQELPSPGPRRAIQRSLRVEEITRILQAIPGPSLVMATELMVHTGLRWGEITELRYQDVKDFPDDDQRVYLLLTRAVADVGEQFNLTGEGRFEIHDRTKNGHDRPLSLSPAMTDRLITYLDHNGINQPDQLLFPASRMIADWETAQPVPDDEIPDNLGYTRPNAQGRTYRHGTMTAYTAGRCTCDWCRRAFALYRRHRRAQGKDLHPHRNPNRPSNNRNLTDHCSAQWFRDTVWKPALKKQASTAGSCPTTSATPTPPSSPKAAAYHAKSSANA
jgi:integrase